MSETWRELKYKVKVLLSNSRFQRLLIPPLIIKCVFYKSVYDLAERKHGTLRIINDQKFTASKDSETVLTESENVGNDLLYCIQLFVQNVSYCDTLFNYFGLLLKAICINYK